MSHFIKQLIFLGSITQWKRITYDGYMYPDWAQAVAWLLALSSFLAIPIFALYAIFHPKGSFREVWKIYCRMNGTAGLARDMWGSLSKYARLQIKRSRLNPDWIMVYCCLWCSSSEDTGQRMVRKLWWPAENKLLQTYIPIRGKEKYSNVLHDVEIKDITRPRMEKILPFEKS